MTEHTLSDETRAKLKKVSTASIATALFKRGLRNQFIQGVTPVSPKDENMVGPAFTLRYIPAREDRNPITVFRNADHPQRVAVETCPEGHVLVMDARKDARAATAGSILVTRLAKRGAAGIVSDGGFRDAHGIGQLAMPAYCAGPSAPTRTVSRAGGSSCQSGGAASSGVNAQSAWPAAFSPSTSSSGAPPRDQGSHRLVPAETRMALR